MTKIFLFLSLLFFSQDWPEFRGPTGQGHSDERGLPLTWSETKNVGGRLRFRERDGLRRRFREIASG